VGEFPSGPERLSSQSLSFCPPGSQALLWRVKRHRHRDCINNSDKNALEEPASRPVDDFRTSVGRNPRADSAAAGLLAGGCAITIRRLPSFAAEELAI